MTAMLFGDDLSKNVDDISKANKIATKLTGSDRGRPQLVLLFCPKAARAGLGAVTPEQDNNTDQSNTETSQRPLQHTVCRKTINE